MKYRLSLVFCAMVLLFAFGLQKGKPAYVVFNKSGKEIYFEKMLKSAASADIVLFGELHNNPICHWLELEIEKELFAIKGNNLVIGAEMFEADNQIILDSFTRGFIEAKAFKAGSRQWPNYKTDYQPLVEFARTNKLAFIATNIPRRFASMVFKGDFKALDTLSALQKSWIAPLPILYDSNLACYKNMLSMQEGHAKSTFPKAQAIKDATMAHFIMANYKKGQLFLHFNGTYHSNNFESIYWYLKQSNPGLKIVTIASAEQENLNSLAKDNQRVADFIIVTPESMTKTY